jgi:hypothetical protein
MSIPNCPNCGTMASRHMVTIRKVLHRILGRGGEETASWAAPSEPAEPIPLGSDAEACNALREILVDATQPRSSVDSLIRGDAILKASVDFRIRHVLSTVEEPVACRKGCGHCCQVPVSAFPFEIFPIAHHVRTSWSGRERRALMRRLRAYRTAVTKPQRGAKHPWCPFLKEGSCSIYDVRPTICRTHHSSDLSACLRDPTKRPASAQPFYRAMLGLYDGAFEALGARSGFPDGYEMALAVEIALREHDALDRFLAGGDPFVAACRHRSTPSRGR